MRFTRNRLSVPTALAAGALSVLVLGANGSNTRATLGCTGADFAETFVNPPEVTSQGGVLDETLDIQQTSFDIGSMPVTSYVYNGLYTPPTLRVKPGDVINLVLKNNMTDDYTNVHMHGLNVSPLGNGDNVFVHVNPGEIYSYEVALPADHPAGLFWYHPHAHGSSQFQVYNGMSGGLIVEGLLDPFPQLAGIADRTLLLKDTYTQDDGTIPPQDGDGNLDTGHSSARTVNGLVNPTMRIQPNELQLWRIGNIGANRYYRLVLEGHEMYEIARDGNRHSQLIPREEILLPPSSRTEVLVRGGREGIYKLRTNYVTTGPVGDQYAEETLATLISLGTPVAYVPLPEASQFPPVPDLREKPVARKRIIKFQEDEDGSNFRIDGKAFDMNRVDTVVRLGDLEEWTLQNWTNELHVFHIHQLDFQVTANGDEPAPFTGYQDTVNMPLRIDENTPSEVKVLIPFTNPIIVGKFVYHCHILEHEDGGMMASIEVVE